MIQTGKAPSWLVSVWWLHGLTPLFLLYTESKIEESITVIKSQLNHSKWCNAYFNKFKSYTILRLRRFYQRNEDSLYLLSRTGNSYKITTMHSCVFLLRAPEPAHWPEETCLIFLGPVYLEEPLITKINQMWKVIISVNKVLTRFILEVHNHLKSRNNFLQVMNWVFFPLNWLFLVGFWGFFWCVLPSIYQNSVCDSTSMQLPNMKLSWNWTDRGAAAYCGGFTSLIVKSKAGLVPPQGYKYLKTFIMHLCIL